LTRTVGSDLGSSLGSSLGSGPGSGRCGDVSATAVRRRGDGRAPLYPRRRAVGRATIAAIALATLAAAPGHGAPAEPPSGAPTIAVASSLRASWPALERAWRATLPAVGARPTFGASRTLARQITRGAPFELFLSADESSIEQVPPARRVDGTSARYAAGRLVLVTLDTFADALSGPAANDDPLARLAARLAAAPDARLAIADPDHAPYGRAAREVLDGAGLWPLPRARLITGENAAQTLQFLLAGGVDAALVPASLTGADAPPPGVRVEPLESARHAPLVHRLVALDGASPAALALGAWFASPAARDALAAAGFDAPP